MAFFEKLKAWFAGSPHPRALEPKEPAPATKPPKSAELAPAIICKAEPTPAAATVREPRQERATRTTPKEDARIEAEARTLFESGNASALLEFLGERSLLFAKHQTSTLPCLCQRCLQPDQRHAESGGVEYELDFVVSWRRALFYWAPRELSRDQTQLRASMRSELRQRLRTLQRERNRGQVEAGPRINPFTGETF